jgi:hypothetical protein
VYEVTGVKFSSEYEEEFAGAVLTISQAELVVFLSILNPSSFVELSIQLKFTFAAEINCPCKLVAGTGIDTLHLSGLLHALIMGHRKESRSRCLMLNFIV